MQTFDFVFRTLILCGAIVMVTAMLTGSNGGRVEKARMKTDDKARKYQALAKALPDDVELTDQMRDSMYRF